MAIEKAPCECSALDNFAVVRMGDSERLDERVFATLENVIDHGGNQWWLYASKCTACGQNWMVAQEERIHDNYYMKRLARDEMQSIIERGDWPADFLQFEQVIKLGPDNNQVCRFLNPADLTDTVKELLEARPAISPSEIAYLLCLSDREAGRIMKRASSTSWAKLRPFA